MPMRLIFVSVLTLALGRMQAVDQAQPSPSLVETQKWLSDTIGRFYVFPTIPIRSENHRTNVQFDGCSVSQTFRQDYRDSDGKVETLAPVVQAFRLGDLDPNKVTTERRVLDIVYFKAVFRCRDDAKCVQIISERGTERAAAGSFDVSDESVAARVKKALEHAVTLCKTPF